MQFAIGSFDSKGNAVVKLSVRGVHKDLAQEFDAIIDTGFTGFLAMPLVKAFPLGLILFGETSLTLADSSVIHRLSALGIGVFGDEESHGVIILEPNSTDILVGMDFLRRFKKALIVSEDGVVLVDQQIVEQFLEAAQKSKEKSPPTTQS